MVTIISNELLQDLNDGKVINIEIGGLGFSLASEKWAEKIEKVQEKENVFKDKLDTEAECDRLRNLLHAKDEEIIALKNACFALSSTLKIEERIGVRY